jgi:SH3 domain
MISTGPYAVQPLQYEYVGERGYRSRLDGGLVVNREYAAGNEQISARDVSKEWTSRSSDHSLQSSTAKRTGHSNFQSQMSPPLTPKVSKETFPEPEIQHEMTFHNYLRAFYPFHPTSTVSSSGDESSITVPINQGDVILVHSVHPNGWADGTLLTSGARGWLPTNYCEPFEPSEIRNLLNSLTNLWDMVRSTEHDSLLVFSRQDYVRGMIAGVRFFLVRNTLVILYLENFC